MGAMTPVSAYTRKITKLFELHEDDVVDNAGAIWVDRVIGCVLTFGGALRKDVDGVYAAADYSIPSSIAPAIPTPSGYIAVISIGKAPTAATTVPTIIYGDSAVNGVAFTTVGSITLDGASQITGRAMAALGTNAAVIAQLGVFDLVDESQPWTMCASGNNASQANGDSYAYKTVSGAGFMTDGVANVITINPLSANDGRRINYFAVIQFGVMPSYQELLAACAEMAMTKELYSNWVA